MTSSSLATKLRSIEAAAIAGLAYAVLTTVALVLLAAPPAPSASDAAITDWYSDPDNRNLLTIGLGLSITAAIAFLWFVAVIRRRVGSREDQFFATVFLGSGTLHTAIALVGAAVLASPAMMTNLSEPNPSDHDIISAITSVGHTLLYIVLVRVQAVFVISTSTLAMRTQAFSRYLSYFGYLIAVVMFVMPIATEPVGLAFPLWVGILSLALITRLADIRTNPQDDQTHTPPTRLDNAPARS
jgi:hypothetical protein